MTNAMANSDWLVANRRYLNTEVERLRLVLKLHIAWLKTVWGSESRQGYQGLVISDTEVTRLLETNAAAEQEFRERDPQARRIVVALTAIESELEIQNRLLGETGNPPALRQLARLFRLTDFERDILFLCVAPELEPSFERLYAYVLDDATRKHATAYLARALFGGQSSSAKDDAALMPQGVLRRLRLILLEPSPVSSGVRSSSPLRVPERVVNYILGANHIDDSVTDLLKPIPALSLAPHHQQIFEALARRVELDGKRGSWPAIDLVGPPASGKRALASALCRHVGLQLCELDVAGIPAQVLERREVLRMLEREAVLSQLAFYIDAAAARPAQAGDGHRSSDWLRQLNSFIVVGGQECSRTDRAMIVAQVPRPDHAAQQVLWQSALSSVRNTVNGELQALVQQFAFGTEAIAKTIVVARNRALLRAGSDDVTVTASDLWNACREQARTQIDGLAQRIAPEHAWEDIVLPETAAIQLREIAEQVALRPQVYETWGFGAKLGRGRGISALFAGPSGTGKTLAAEILAGHLDLDLFRVDLSGIVNKYIGETEKNLRRVFDAAEQSGAILFFDEADALFGKRSDVKDSHDRYANIEVNYLLQRMEDYRGLAILATNKKSHLDQAFLRRLRFIVDFPLPNLPHRARIWQSMFPKQASVEPLDFNALAKLEISGGNIKNIAVNAAFLAAAQRSSIRMDHVLEAARREYSKIEKLVSGSDFGPLCEARPK
ncbi:MAG TPA: AAA family ATPase [Polyangiaceae bacterium]